MPDKIFVNLPVRDLDKSKAFFEALGFAINPLFSDETAVSVVISEHIYAMLLTHEKFRQFTKKEIADASKTTEVLIALSVDRKATVDDLVSKAVRAGGREARQPSDHGFMYEHAFEDPDGHIWEVVWMDPAALPGQH